MYKFRSKTSRLDDDSHGMIIERKEAKEQVVCITGGGAEKLK